MNHRSHSVLVLAIGLSLLGVTEACSDDTASPGETSDGGATSGGGTSGNTSGGGTSGNTSGGGTSGTTSDGGTSDSGSDGGSEGGAATGGSSTVVWVISPGAAKFKLWISALVQTDVCALITANQNKKNNERIFFEAEIANATTPTWTPGTYVEENKPNGDKVQIDVKEFHTYDGACARTPFGKIVGESITLTEITNNGPVKGSLTLTFENNTPPPRTFTFNASTCAAPSGGGAPTCVD